eukprot:3368318-Amphidinium_carterae.1
MRCWLVFDHPHAGHSQITLHRAFGNSVCIVISFVLVLISVRLAQMLHVDFAAPQDTTTLLKLDAHHTRKSRCINITKADTRARF